MTNTIELNYYRVKDLDLGLYVLEGDGVLNLFKEYSSALEYAREHNYNLENHCN